VVTGERVSHCWDGGSSLKNWSPRNTAPSNFAADWHLNKLEPLQSALNRLALQGENNIQAV